MAPGITEARLRAGTLEGRRGWKALPLRQWKRPNDALSPTLSREPSSFLLPSWGSLSPSVSRRNKAVGENHSKTEYPYSSSKALLWYSWKIPVTLWCFKCSNVHDDEWKRQSTGWCMRLSHQPRELLLIQHLPHSVLFTVLAKLQTTTGHGLSILQNHKCYGLKSRGWATVIPKTPHLLKANCSTAWKQSGINWASPELRFELGSAQCLKLSISEAGGNGYRKFWKIL